MNIGVSECLTGLKVRFDGTDAGSSLPHDKLAGLFNLVPVCPEVGIGMPVPRAPIQLRRSARGVRLVAVADCQDDKTDAIVEFAHQTVADFDDLAGFLFMHRSPSCGLSGVKVYGTSGNLLARSGRGLFAQTIMQQMPLLPVEDGIALFDDGVFENFVVRAQTYAHWQATTRELSTESLLAFHAAHGEILKAQDLNAYARAQQLIDDLTDKPINDLAQRYIAVLMQGLANRPTMLAVE